MPNKEEYRREATNVRLVDPVHARLKEHNREGETLSGTVGRALDALDREADLPDAVTAAMGEDDE